MLDRYSNRILARPLDALATLAERRGITPDQVTLAGFAGGMMAVPLLALGWYYSALAFILASRVMDGVDGALARRTATSDAGGFLDIVCDFIFYSAVVFGFALADPEHNALAAAALIFAFIGTGASFLAYAVMAARNQLSDPVVPRKSLYFLGGLAEGTETIACLSLFCLMPHHFVPLAWGFTLACWITTVTRIYSGYHSLQQVPREENGCGSP
jgi:phosphatidylglycerophosphate synthase